jgi:hypothetical protein
MYPLGGTCKALYTGSIPVAASSDMGGGEAWCLDLNLRHSVVNGSRTERVDLVIDCVVNEWLGGALRSGLAVGTALREAGGRGGVDMVQSDNPRPVRRGPAVAVILSATVAALLVAVAAPARADVFSNPGTITFRDPNNGTICTPPPGLSTPYPSKSWSAG